MNDVKVPFFLLFPLAFPCLETLLEDDFDGDDFDVFFAEELRVAEELPLAPIGRESVGETPAAVNEAAPAASVATAVAATKPSTLLSSILPGKPLGMIPSLPFVDE